MGYDSVNVIFLALKGILRVDQNDIQSLRNKYDKYSISEGQICQNKSQSCNCMSGLKGAIVGKILVKILAMLLTLGNFL